MLLACCRCILHFYFVNLISAAKWMQARTLRIAKSWQLQAIEACLKFKYLVTGRRRNSIYAKQNHNPSIIHQAANGRNFIDTRQPASSDTDTTHLYLGGMRRRFSVLFGSYFFFLGWGPLMPGLFFISFYIFCYACKAQIPSV